MPNRGSDISRYRDTTRYKARRRFARPRTKIATVDYILAAALIVAFGLAALYSLVYGNVDQSVARGHISFYKDNSLMLKVDINDDMTARVEYLGRTFTGKFVLDGAEEDTILFQLKNIKFEAGNGASDTYFFFRMPRSGLQGNFTGPWMTYYSCPSQGVQHSDWAITMRNGTASVGSRDEVNAMVTQRSRLLEWSSEWTWTRVNGVLRLYSKPAGA